MRALLILATLVLLTWAIYHTSVLIHNFSPSLRVVEEKVDMTNIEAAERGNIIAPNRQYFRKIVYKEIKQTKGLRVEVTRDTISNEVFYNEDK